MFLYPLTAAHHSASQSDQSQVSTGSQFIFAWLPRSLMDEGQRSGALASPDGTTGEETKADPRAQMATSGGCFSCRTRVFFVPSPSGSCYAFPRSRSVAPPGRRGACARREECSDRCCLQALGARSRLPALIWSVCSIPSGGGGQAPVGRASVRVDSGSVAGQRSGVVLLMLFRSGSILSITAVTEHVSKSLGL